MLPLKFRISLFIVLVISCENNNVLKNSKTDETLLSNNKLLNFKVDSILLHDTTSFTEGLFFHNRLLFESTGAPIELPQTKSLFGITNLITGKINVKVEVDKNKYFGEGIVAINKKIYQLTYLNRIGFIYDEASFKKIGEFSLPSNEGWGLTCDKRNIIMSDGTDSIWYINPSTLKINKVLIVTENNIPLYNLNELEFVNGFIFANVWKTNRIVKIDTLSGKVVGNLDLTSLTQDSKLRYPGSMEMNGIAYDSIENKFYVTGKLWPSIYKISISN